MTFTRHLSVNRWGINEFNIVVSFLRIPWQQVFFQLSPLFSNQNFNKRIISINNFNVVLQNRQTFFEQICLLVYAFFYCHPVASVLMILVYLVEGKRSKIYDRVCAV
jgi:hypothetical protein